MMRWLRKKKESGEIVTKPSFPFEEGGLLSVQTPEEMKDLFVKAEERVSKYFEDMEWNPQNGRIIIGGERYILVRAAAMRIDFPEVLATMMGLKGGVNDPSVVKILYQLAKSLGRADARKFHFSMGLDDPIAKLSAGPVHFAFTGWANVNILPESKPSPDENYYLTYTHPHSFEADAYIYLKGHNSPIPVCVMNSGYSAGWCTESFGVDLDARELTCRAHGDKECLFVMTHTSKLEEAVKNYWKSQSK